MTKEYFIKFIVFLGKTWSYLYSYKTNAKAVIVKDILYSAWISREFKSYGRNSIIRSNGCLVGGQYISIGDRCSIGARTVLTAWDKHGVDSFSPHISIGSNVSIGDDAHITAMNRVEIGNYVLTGKKVTITDNAHGKSNFELLSLPPATRPLYSEGPVIIEDGVWIGDKVTILPNVRIGKNAIVGANAVVTRDIPSNCIAVGIPAKVIKIL